MVPIVEAVLREIRNKSLKNRLQKKDFGENIQADEVRKRKKTGGTSLLCHQKNSRKTKDYLAYSIKKIQYHDRRGTRKSEKGASGLAS